ncbi:folate-binding protein YgfZ [Acuticoccus sp. I52.16.1]|uniref:CAF17-like 4Fe-4S cluster assembly/insertion protein YgfZ n=1 Tax=Acuticoccus sp. I52.16.1 TaxID=2928472 RepID=UPI001FD240FD|nr:folate-binding protein [Acuticoccus sp. I52.16.1]UOM35863.1 folate-binding protein [Acuticoccus sp. I52.16.1]
MAIALNERTVVMVGGEDRLTFLDGLVTCSTKTLAPGALAYGALLTPQGKILTDLFVHTRDDHLFLDLPASAAADIVRRLTMYKLRAAVTLETTDAAVILGEGPPDPRAVTVSVALDGAVDGFDVGGRSIGVGTPGDAAPYHAARIAAGIPDAVLDFELGDAFPHDANMDITGAVDFQKGCFVGQEVVSRMRHRGTARRRTVRVSADAPLPETGAPVTANGRVIGRLGTTVGAAGLAVVRIDRVKGEVKAGDVTVRLAPPPGATFALAGEEASEGAGA